MRPIVSRPIAYAPVMPPLEGCRAKITRAEFHLVEMRFRVREYLQHAPYRVVGEYQQATGEFVLRAEAVAGVQPVPLELTLIAGEVVHQLRSALDHLVFDLVIENTGAEPPGIKSGFPIFKAVEGYNDRAPAMIRGVADAAVTRIRGAQPFHLGDRAEEALTWAVQQLNNTDKHRTIPMTFVYPFAAAVHMRIGNDPPIPIVPWQEEVGEPLTDGKEIARVRLPDGTQNATFNVPVGVDIAFVQVGALRNHPVNDLLLKATDHIRQLIASFEPEFAVLRAN